MPYIANMNAGISDDVTAHIDQLWIHPVKSCAGIGVQSAELTPTGLRWDRHWMVVDATGEFVTQRELPRMALIRPSLTAERCELRAPGMPVLGLPFEGSGGVVNVSVWGDALQALDVGDEAAAWFSRFLGTGAPADFQKLRLVRFAPGARRHCSAKWTGGREALTQFADGFGVLVAGSASLQELNGRLADARCSAVDMARFRPNIVLGGMESHDEDRIGEWRIATDLGEAVMDNVKPCARCPIPNIDPTTGVPSSEVGDALQTYRHDRRLGGAVTFGMNAIVLEGVGQMLRVGQKVAANWRFDG